MPSVSIKQRDNIALSIIAVEFILNVFMRLGDDATELIGNLFCLVLLSIAATIISTGLSRFVALIVFGYMVSLLPDTIIFRAPMEVGWNDVLFMGVWITGVRRLWLKQGAPSKINASILFLLLILAVKSISQHSLLMIGERFVVMIGDATTHLLFAVLFCRYFLSKAPFIPIVLLAGTVNQFRKNTVGNPDVTDPIELLVFLWLVANLILWEVYKRMAKTAEKRELYWSIVISVNILFVYLFCTMR